MTNTLLLTITNFMTVYMLEKWRKELSNNATIEGPERARLLVTVRRQKNLLFMLVMIWFSSMMSLTPLNICMMIYNYCPDRCGLVASSLVIPAAFVPLKSVVSSFIFLGRIPEFRQVVVGHLVSLRCRRGVHCPDNLHMDTDNPSCSTAQSPVCSAVQPPRCYPDQPPVCSAEVYCTDGGLQLCEIHKPESVPKSK